MVFVVLDKNGNLKTSVSVDVATLTALGIVAARIAVRW